MKSIGIKIFTCFFLSLILIVPAGNLLAENSNDVNIYFFWGNGCPHCAKEEVFLNKFEKENPNVTIFDFEVWANKENREYLIEVGKELGADVSGVPFVVIGDETLIGYADGWTDKKIEERVEYCSLNYCPDSVAEIVGISNNNSEIGENPISTEEDLLKETENKEGIAVPILGHLDISKLSLPMLTITLGALDGFNPCAMWTLLFLISLLLGMQDRRRMWILGTAFIVASAAVYFIFMAAWLNLLLFIGLIIWIRILIGLVALIGGGYNLREYFKNRAGTCKVTEGDRQQKVFEKLRDITKEKNFLVALGGIILLAFAVNLVELLCSAGLPAIYTQVLALNNLASWQYYLYLLLYIFIFMLDDLIVFVIAMTALRVTGLTNKYTRYSHLIGGILMLLIGLAMIFKPELLLFG